MWFKFSSLGEVGNAERCLQRLSFEQAHSTSFKNTICVIHNMYVCNCLILTILCYSSYFIAIQSFNHLYCTTVIIYFQLFGDLVNVWNPPVPKVRIWGEFPGSWGWKVNPFCRKRFQVSSGFPWKCEILRPSVKFLFVKERLNLKNHVQLDPCATGPELFSVNQTNSIKARHNYITVTSTYLPAKKKVVVHPLGFWKKKNTTNLPKHMKPWNTFFTSSSSSMFFLFWGVVEIESFCRCKHVDTAHRPPQQIAVESGTSKHQRRGMDQQNPTLPWHKATNSQLENAKFRRNK